MAENWSVEYEAGLADYEAAQDVAQADEADEAQVVDCDGCGRQVIDGTICEACGMPTEAWVMANDEDDCPLDGDAESALASAGFGTDEDYGYYGGDE